MRKRNIAKIIKRKKEQEHNKSAFKKSLNEKRQQ